MLTPRLVVRAALLGVVVASSSLYATGPDTAAEVRRQRAQRALEENRRAQEREAAKVDMADLPAVDQALVDEYTDMIAVVASPEMEGRVPGSQGIEKAANYIQEHIEALGLGAAFTDEDGNASYRQPFQMGVHTAAKSVTLDVGDVSFTSFDEASPLAFSGSDIVTAPVVFTGYAIVSGPNNYLGFETNETVDGKIAIVLNYEPMDDEGYSRWRDEGWSHNARLTYKVTALQRRGAAGVIIVSPPMAQDDRVGVLETVESTSPPSNRAGERGGPEYDIPIVHATPEVVGSILSYTGTGETLDDLIAKSNESGAVIPLGDKDITLGVELERTPNMTANLGAILLGKGELANQFVVVGSHYDHVGYGKFGTRIATDRGKLHPGADDNASGTVANLITAQLLKERYGTLSDEDSARSVLFLWFSAEESGLNGSQFYVEHPIAPLDTIDVMLNMDMVGTLSDGLLEIGGLDSGDGLEALVKPALTASGLPYSEDVSVGSGRSDHASFDRAGVPAVFFFTGLHERYHTPRDTVDLIDDEGGVRIAALVSDIAFDAATTSTKIIHPRAKNKRDENQGPKVRVGIIPSNARQGGIKVEKVFEDTSASEAGLKPGDRIVKWNGTEIDSVESWLPIITAHEPGDKVTLEVVRGGKTLTLEMTLRGIE